MDKKTIELLKSLEEIDAQKDRLILDLMNGLTWALNLEGMTMLDDGSWNSQAHFDHIRNMLNKAIKAGYEVE